jgi:beta-phosphoglucomutase-like phosphatase (HAD superfamily)
MPGLVIFDCDGVLVDSEAISNRVMAAAISREGLPITAAGAQATYQGMLLAEIGTDVERRLGHPLPTDFWARFEADRELAFAGELEPVTGARELLEATERAGLPRCVASQGQQYKTEFTLGHTGLRRFFGQDALFSAYQVPRGKPHPDLFLHAARTMGVEPGCCVVIEDSTSGMTAGVATGMQVIAYVAERTSVPVLPNTSIRTVRHLTEILPLLGINS